MFALKCERSMYLCSDSAPSQTNVTRGTKTSAHSAITPAIWWQFAHNTSVLIGPDILKYACDSPRRIRGQMHPTNHRARPHRRWGYPANTLEVYSLDLEPSTKSQAPKLNRYRSLGARATQVGTQHQDERAEYSYLMKIHIDFARTR